VKIEMKWKHEIIENGNESVMKIMSIMANENGKQWMANGINVKWMAKMYRSVSIIEEMKMAAI